LFVVLYGCETGSLTLSEVTGNGELRSVFGPRRMKYQGSEENYIMRSLLNYTPHQILFGWWNREEWNERGTFHIWGRGQLYTRYCWGILREIDDLKNPDTDGDDRYSGSGMGHGLHWFGSG